MDGDDPERKIICGRPPHGKAAPKEIPKAIMPRYNFRENEAKWQRRWRERRLFEVDAEAGRPKYYILEMYP